MKPFTIIIALVLSLQVSTLFAGNDCIPVASKNDAGASYCVSLAPSVPLEATFEDYVYSNDAGAFINLAPVAPVEADFNDSAEVNWVVDFKEFAPVTPAEADFSDL